MYGNLKVLEIVGTIMCDDVFVVYFSHTGGNMGNKKCSGCQQDLPLNLFSKDKYQKSGYRCKCKGCSAVEFTSYSNTENYTKRLEKQVNTRRKQKETNPTKYWAHTAFHNAKKRAADNGLEFSITKQWLEENAPQTCVLLGVELIYNANKSSPSTASLDRKDSAKGYTPDNCKIISFKANRIKSNASVEEIITLAKNMQNY